MQVSRCVYSTEENGQATKDQICLSQSLKVKHKFVVGHGTVVQLGYTTIRL